VGEENYMVRTVGAESWVQEDEEPAPAGDVLTPVHYWSHNLKLRPLIAPKKKWVEPE